MPSSSAWIGSPYRAKCPRKTKCATQYENATRPGKSGMREIRRCSMAFSHGESATATSQTGQDDLRVPLVGHVAHCRIQCDLARDRWSTGADGRVERRPAIA